jgi:4-aminobutyrate aminotransferase-like enzyme
VGSAVLEELNNKNLVKKSSVNGNVLHSELNKLKERFPEDIQQINGKGLIAAIIFSEKYKQAQYAQKISEITEKCFQKGLLVVHTGRESIKIGPPLTITQEAIMEGVNVILEAVQEVLG